jgi:hypothetical protein
MIAVVLLLAGAAPLYLASFTYSPVMSARERGVPKRSPIQE